MDPLRLDAAAARVVAWHNRHPLARRIDAAHVHSVGYVALPFERTQAQGRAASAAAALHGVFSEAVLPPLKAGAVARWAARHGAELAQDPSDAPLHYVRPDRAPAAAAAPVTLYLLTAAVEVGEQRRRVLLGSGDKPPLLGRRLWSGPRAAAALALLGAGVALVGLAVTLALRPAEPAAPVQVVVRPAAAASSAGRAVTAAQTASASAGTDADTATATATAVPGALAPSAPAAAQPEASAEPVPAAAGQATALAAPVPGQPAAPADPARPKAPPLRPSIRPGLDLGPHLGRIALPELRPQLGEGVRARARQMARAAPATQATQTKQATPTAGVARMGASAPTATPPAPLPGAAAAGAAPSAPPAHGALAAASTPAAAAPVAAKAAFAVTTHALRTHAEAEQIMDAMAALLRGAGARQAQVEILPQGDDWRVVVWPFARRDDAEKARAVLVARGMRVSVVDF